MPPNANRSLNLAKNDGRKCCCSICVKWKNYAGLIEQAQLSQILLMFLAAAIILKSTVPWTGIVYTVFTSIQIAVMQTLHTYRISMFYIFLKRVKKPLRDDIFKGQFLSTKPF